MKSAGGVKSGAAAFTHRRKKMVCVWTRPEPAPGRRFPAVLFLHGFPGSEKNVDLQRTLLRAGVASLSLHFSGAWGSEGAYRFTTLLSDARAGLRYLSSRPGVDRRKLAVFGFSMGGWSAIHLGALERRLRAVVAVAPVGGAEMDRGKATREKIAKNCAALRVASVEELYRDFAKAVKAGDPAASASRLSCPLLLVHGTADELVPQTVSRRIFESARPPKRLVLVRGAGHDFLDRRPQLVRIVAGWLLRQLKA